MINILYIGNKLKRENTNATTIETLGNHLIDEGFNVTYSSSRINKLFRITDMLLSVIKHRKKVDYVLIDTYSTQNFYYTLAVSQLCRLFKIKFIPILHGGNLESRLKNNPGFCNRIFKKAYANVSPSIFLKNCFNNYGYDNVKFIPNSIKINEYSYQNKLVDKPKLFWLRSYKKIYNPLMAINAASSLKEKGFDVELCMVGPDGDGSFLYAKKLARDLNLDVNFNMKLKKREWVELSNNYNVFINTSNFDNLPVSVIEAMALGFPIVSTNVGGLPFLINDGLDGLLVDENDVEQMTQKIISIVQNQEFANKLGLEARKKAEQFDWEVVKLDWKNLLK